jgi:hypothetical protein
VAVGEALAEAEADVLAEAAADAAAEAEAEEEGDALAAVTGIGLESSTTEQTVQVLCSLPSLVEVASSATVQSVATWPVAGICSV